MTAINTSYPFLRIARYYNVNYGDVLTVAEACRAVRYGWPEEPRYMEASYRLPVGVFTRVTDTVLLMEHEERKGR